MLTAVVGDMFVDLCERSKEKVNKDVVGKDFERIGDEVVHLAPPVYGSKVGTLEGDWKMAEPLTQDQREALERLIRHAQGVTGQSRKVASFLLAWWNAEDWGGFDLTGLWGVDDDIAKDMVTVFALVASHHNYPDTLGYKKQFELLVALWRSTLNNTKQERKIPRYLLSLVPSLFSDSRFEEDGEHPVFTRADWMRAIAVDETQDGYWQWVKQKEHGRLNRPVEIRQSL